MMYIYAPKGEQVYTSEHGPTKEDFDMINDGQLDVIRVEDGLAEYCFGEEGIMRYQEVAKGQRVRHIETGDVWTVPVGYVEAYQEQGEWVIL